MKILNYEHKSLALTAGILLLSIVVQGQQDAYESPAGTKFLLYTPPGYVSGTSTFPLLLCLHGKGEMGYDLTELTSVGSPHMPCRLISLNQWPQDLPFIVLTPQLKPEDGDPDPEWGPQWPPGYIDEVVRYVTANFRVDLLRIYVTGLSKGGNGTWNYASAYPEKVAAIIPISGRSDLTKACAVKNIPSWIFHGDNDHLVTPEYSINMVNAINACQPAGIYKPRLKVLHARNHNGWNEVYNGSSGYKIYEWLLKFRKGDTSNKRPYVNAGPDLRVPLRNNPLHIIGDFFDSDGTITNATWRQTGGTPLILNNTASELLQLSELTTGLFEFELTVTDDKGGQSSDKVALEITNNSATPSITRLVLYNGKTDAEIGDLSEGQIINKTTLNLTEINIRAIPSDGTASIKFSVNTDRNTRTQSNEPYFIKNPTTIPEWEIGTGTYLICATPYARNSAGGNPGVSQCYNITFTEGTNAAPCAGTGKIQQELWNGIPGTSIASIPVNQIPASITDLTLFEGPGNIGDNYGRRIRGYICAPVSGTYIFWIASNDNSELWLSTDENAANRTRVAYVTGYTNVRGWDKYTTQKSASISLVANRKYYIEALHKEGAGTDHIAVGWQLPVGTQERPIPGIRLIPFKASGTSPVPVVSITSPADGQTFTAPTSMNITANASVSGGTIMKVEFHNGTIKLGEDVTSPYSFAWNNVPAGNYTLTAKATDNAGGSATASVNIIVTNSTSACISTGTILREVWTGIQYNDVGSIQVLDPPDGTSELTIFENPTNVGDNYGTRVSGYLCVPVTGPYTFWISSNDNSELWLSTDANRSGRRRVAWVTGFTNAREWTKYPSQKSVAINLLAGQRYYIEALHKEGVGADHMAVGWQLPNGALERPIPGHRLSPSEKLNMSAFQTSTTSRQKTDVESGLDIYKDDRIYIFPNPVPEGWTRITLYVIRKMDKNVEEKVDIITMEGEVVHVQNIRSSNRSIQGHRTITNIETELKPGFYLVTVTDNGRRLSTRLLVK
jgi:predicted esterase